MSVSGDWDSVFGASPSESDCGSRRNKGHRKTATELSPSDLMDAPCRRWEVELFHWASQSSLDDHRESRSYLRTSRFEMSTMSTCSTVLADIGKYSTTRLVNHYTCQINSLPVFFAQSQDIKWQHVELAHASDASDANEEPARAAKRAPPTVPHASREKIGRDVNSRPSAAHHRRVQADTATIDASRLTLQSSLASSQPAPMASPTDNAAQADELEALRSIYDTALTVPRPGTLVLSLPVSPPSPLRLALPGDILLPLPVPHLPPAVLTVAFPFNYPSAVPPRLHLSIPYAPLAQMHALADRLPAMFTPAMPVVFDWASAVQEFVQEEVLKPDHSAQGAAGRARRQPGYILQLVEDPPPSSAVDRRIARPRVDTNVVARSIQAFAVRSERARVDAGYFKCPACWDTFPGTECTSLSACRHVACNECLAGFWGTRIADGRVHAKDIVCVESECSAPAHATEVRHVLDKFMYDKYEMFLLNRALETDNEFVHCPRQGCTQMAGMDPDDPNMGRCAYCLYVFCVKCSKKWHAPANCGHAPANCERDEAEELNVGELVWQMEAATDEERERMRKEWSAVTWEKVETAMAICSLGGKTCPDCGILVVKDGGCAHMRCLCGCEFCWFCRERLDHDGFTQHYQPGNGCHMYEDWEMQHVHEQIWDWVYNGDDAI